MKRKIHRPSRALAAAAAFMLMQYVAAAQSDRNAPAGPQSRENPSTAPSPQLQPSTLNLSEIKIFKAGKDQPQHPGPPGGARPPIMQPLSADDLAAAEKHILKPLIPRSAPGASGSKGDGVVGPAPTKITLTPVQANAPGQAWLRFDNAVFVEFEPSAMAFIKTLYIRVATSNQVHMFDVWVHTPDNPATELLVGKCVFTVTGPDAQVQLIPCSPDHSKIQHLLFGMIPGANGQQSIMIEAPIPWHFARVDITKQ